MQTDTYTRMVAGDLYPAGFTRKQIKHLIFIRWLIDTGKLSEDIDGR